MASVPISKFKAQCLAMLENVRKTGKPLRITRFGKPVADIIPATLSAPPSWLGLLAADGEVSGDLIEPVVREREWDALSSPARTRRKGGP
jgi:prevent-host-death family protein